MIDSDPTYAADPLAGAAAPPDSRNYKTVLLNGEIDPELARLAGSVLAEIHTKTAQDHSASM